MICTIMNEWPINQKNQCIASPAHHHVINQMITRWMDNEPHIDKNNLDFEVFHVNENRRRWSPLKLLWVSSLYAFPSLCNAYVFCSKFFSQLFMLCSIIPLFRFVIELVIGCWKLLEVSFWIQLEWGESVSDWF